MKIFSGKRYFNDILWAAAYNNNTLPDTGISSNKIYKILAKTHFKCKKKVKKPTFLRKHVSLSCLHFSLMFSEGEVKSPYFLQVW
jgi:hypothetical protein